MSWDWEELKKEHQREDQPFTVDNQLRSGAALGEWISKHLGRFWTIVWVLVLWAAGWLVAGVLIKFGFVIADKTMHWWNYM